MDAITCDPGAKITIGTENTGGLQELFYNPNMKMQQLANIPGKIVPRKGLRIGNIVAEGDMSKACMIEVKQAKLALIDINCLEAKKGSVVEMNPF